MVQEEQEAIHLTLAPKIYWIGLDWYWIGAGGDLGTTIKSIFTHISLLLRSCVYLLTDLSRSSSNAVN